MADEIDRWNPEPVYLQLAAILRGRIERGELVPWQPLPSESYLTGRYGVSRGTTRRAVEVLRNESLVRTIPQRGTYVSEPGTTEIAVSGGIISVVTLTDAWPKPGEPFTVSDLDRMPDDGHRYELLDGTLIVSPAPGPAHQRVAVMLCHLLELVCPEELVVFPNVGVRIGSRSALEPDVVVARATDVSGARLARPPLLVAEILSPDSALRDLNLKKAAYERFGIPSYWVIDPDLNQPSIRAFALVDGGYREAAQAAGDEPFRADQPFPVEVVPARLVAKLRAR